MTLFLIFIFFLLTGFWLWYETTGKSREKQKIAIERKTRPQAVEKEIPQKAIYQIPKTEPEKPLISEPPQKKALPPSNLPTAQ